MTVLGKTSDAYCCLGDCCALGAEGKPRVSEWQLPFTHSPYSVFRLCKAGGITASAPAHAWASAPCLCGLPGQA